MAEQTTGNLIGASVGPADGNGSFGPCLLKSLSCPAKRFRLDFIFLDPSLLKGS